MSDLKDAAKELAKLARTFAGVAKLAPMLDHLGDLDAYGQRLKKQNATLMMQQDTLRLELASGEAELDRKLSELRDKHNEVVSRDQAKLAVAREDLERLRLKAENDAAGIINDAKARAESILAEARKGTLTAEADANNRISDKTQKIDKLSAHELKLMQNVLELEQRYAELHLEMENLRKRLTA